MSWFHNRYTERPSAKNQGARIAWDVLTDEAAEMSPPRRVMRLWYAPEMEAWNALLDGPEQYIEIDVICVSDRKHNPYKYTKPVGAERATKGDAS